MNNENDFSFPPADPNFDQRVSDAIRKLKFPVCFVREGVPFPGQKDLTFELWPDHSQCIEIIYDFSIQEEFCSIKQYRFSVNTIKPLENAVGMNLEFFEGKKDSQKFRFVETSEFWDRFAEALTHQQKLMDDLSNLGA